VKTWHVILALLITVVVLVGTKAYRYVDGRPARSTAYTGEFSLSHAPVRSHSGMDTSPFFTVRFDGPKAPGTFKTFLHYFPTTRERESDVVRNFIRLPMPLGEESIDEYDVYLPPYPAGSKLEYYITAETEDRTILAVFPMGGDPTGNTIELQFEGVVPAWVVVIYISFAFAALFTALLLALKLVSARRSSADWKLILSQTIWTGIFYVLGVEGSRWLYAHYKWASLQHLSWPLNNSNLESVLFYSFPILIISLHCIAKSQQKKAATAGDIKPPIYAWMLAIVVLTIVVVKSMIALGN